VSIVNFGSLNIDDVYSVDHIVRPGETLSAQGYQIFPGGKGNNQSIALGRAGARVRHVGKVGADGQWLLPLLQSAGVDTSGVTTDTGPTGRAIIQVDSHGQNSIVLFPGANRTLSEADIRRALEACTPDDIILTQNETSGVGFLLAEAQARGLFVALNPAPMGPEVLSYPLEGLGLLIVNETEAEALVGPGTPDQILAAMARRFPSTQVVLTLGAAGVIFQSAAEGRFEVAGRRVSVVDTTAAGDTFLGFFLAARQRGLAVREALETANAAAAITVTRPGAASSIPHWDEVLSASSTR